jgi:spore coat protein A
MEHAASMSGHGSTDMEGARPFKDYDIQTGSGRRPSGTTTIAWTSPDPQVWRGLAGFHILRDDEEDALPLPKGEKDVPLMICDRSFDEDGSFPLPVPGSLADGQTGRRG